MNIPRRRLLDMMTMREKFGRLEGLKVAIVGDIAHSRVAGSNIRGLRTMGAQVMLCGPKTLMPCGCGGFWRQVTLQAGRGHRLG